MQFKKKKCIIGVDIEGFEIVFYDSDTKLESDLTTFLQLFFFNCNSAGCHRQHPAAKQSARKTSDPVQTPDSASNVVHTFQGNDVFWEYLTVRAELYGIHRPQHTKPSFNINTR